MPGGSYAVASPATTPWQARPHIPEGPGEVTQSRSRMSRPKGVLRPHPLDSRHGDPASMPGGNYAVASPAVPAKLKAKPGCPESLKAKPGCPAKQQNTQRIVIPAKAGIQDGKWQNSKQNIWGDHIGRGSEGMLRPSRGSPRLRQRLSSPGQRVFFGHTLWNPGRAGTPGATPLENPASPVSAR